MPVKHLPPGSPGIIVRSKNAPVFSGAPLAPEPTSPRGKRRSANTPEYQQNWSTRQAQSCPAQKTGPRFKGPSHRAPGISAEQWERVMTGKLDGQAVQHPHWR